MIIDKTQIIETEQTQNWKYNMSTYSINGIQFIFIGESFKLLILFSFEQIRFLTSSIFYFSKILFTLIDDLMFISEKEVESDAAIN